MSENTARDLAIELTIETTMVCESINGRSVYINQLMRACSSIGANVSEAKYAQSRADLVHKLEIALKECYETEYWLEIFFKLGDIENTKYTDLCNKCGRIRRILIASLSTAKSSK